MIRGASVLLPGLLVVVDVGCVRCEVYEVRQLKTLFRAVEEAASVFYGSDAA